MRCPTCGGSHISTVSFDAGDGATYRFCSWCEAGWWQTEAERVSTQEMLVHAGRIEPAKRRQRGRPARI